MLFSLLSITVCACDLRWFSGENKTIPFIRSFIHCILIILQAGVGDYNINKQIKVMQIGASFHETTLKQQTEALLVGTCTRSKLDKVNACGIIVGESHIAFNNSVKDLDQGLTMASHVNQITKTCFMHLRNIGSIRHLLTNEAAHLMAQ